jgi:hypothetical protein
MPFQEYNSETRNYEEKTGNYNGSYNYEKGGSAIVFIAPLTFIVIGVLINLYGYFSNWRFN